MVFFDGEEILVSFDISWGEVNNGLLVFRMFYFMIFRYGSNYKCLCGCGLGLFINLVNDVLFYWLLWG